MKTKKIYLAAVLAGLSLLVAMRPADVLTDTGVTMTNVKEGVMTNLEKEGKFTFYTNFAIRKAAMQIPAGSRANTVRMLGKVVRSYVESAAFADNYRKNAEAMNPADEAYSDESIQQRESEINQADGMVNAQMQAMQQGFSQLEPGMLYNAINMQVTQWEADASQAGDKEREQMMYLKKLLKTHAANKPEFKKQYLLYLQRQMQEGSAGDVEKQKQKLAEAKAKNAEYQKQKALQVAKGDYRPVLRKQLTAFIALCNSVDFNAKLESRGYRQEFVNPAYRNKSSEWKLLFRMGQEPVMAAKAFAQEWLADVNKLAQK